MVAWFKRISESKWFQNFITGAIVLAGIVIGIETYPAAIERWGGALHAIDKIILWIFVAEVIIKMGAEGKRPWRYFYDPWNVFDFLIVAVCFLPFDAQYVAVLRLARLLRVLKLVRALPKLQILVSALLKSIPSMGYVGLLLIILFYLYAVAAVFLFGPNDPVHFEDLPIAMLSLFRAVTGEDWTDIMYIQMHGCANYGYGGMEHLCTQSTAYPVFSPLYFVSFMLFGAMVILNLFIGVIMNGMDEARKENAALDAEARGESFSLEKELLEVSEDLIRLHDRMENLQTQIALRRKRGEDLD